jgi:hypothetical protein
MKTAPAVVVQSRPLAKHGTLREALFIGALAASVVSLWLLLIDSLTGDPFLTPRSLALLIAGPPSAAGSASGALLLVVGYTTLYYAAFAALGGMIVLALQASDREPALLVFFLMLAEVLEVAFHGAVAIVHEVDVLAGSEWLRFGGANLLALFAIGWYVWYGYPAARRGVIGSAHA